MTPHPPELRELTQLLGTRLAERLATAAGGWRTLSDAELVAMALTPSELEAVGALQRLLRRDYPCLAVGALTNSATVGQAYEAWMAARDSEVILVLAVDARGHLLAEIEVATGGRHGAGVTPVDVFRPLIRAGAAGFVLLHNHPSGDPTPSPEDVTMTHAVAAIGDVVGIALLDHVIVAARGGGYQSMLDLGLLHPSGDNHGQDRSHPAVCC